MTRLKRVGNAQHETGLVSAHGWMLMILPHEHPIGRQWISMWSGYPSLPGLAPLRGPQTGTGIT